MIAKAWYVTCDLCGNPTEVNTESAAAARRDAKSNGFVRRRVRREMLDLCPACQTRRALSNGEGTR